MTYLSETDAMNRLLSPEMQATMAAETDLISLQIEAALEDKGFFRHVKALGAELFAKLPDGRIVELSSHDSRLAA